MDRETGRSRGFGFVEMSNDDEASAVVKELDGKEIDGRVVRVSEVNRRKMAAEAEAVEADVEVLRRSPRLRWWWRRRRRPKVGNEIWRSQIVLPALVSEIESTLSFRNG